ncbi:hypothetical protein BKH46_01780 [Helicobacter sp. 12S02634-8]|uniref:hypothetical protein n=1 Tax=Helicobacter sp. 12S02634-8 TaxID=1476199 RepID=UPI000BA58091|nr:hypothetical protein [Helicobacter sp. 12S02634-8]PAF48065.1 hypothetical protein BKH46_01780 [Helicobacter sp. 12S02634-8]
MEALVAFPMVFSYIFEEVVPNAFAFLPLVILFLLILFCLVFFGQMRSSACEKCKMTWAFSRQNIQELSRVRCETKKRVGSDSKKIKVRDFYKVQRSVDYVCKNCGITITNIEKYEETIHEYTF